MAVTVSGFWEKIQQLRRQLFRLGGGGRSGLVFGKKIKTCTGSRYTLAAVAAGVWTGLIF